MEFKRYLNIEYLLKENSYFLLGPRMTGKSTLIKKDLVGKFQIINLLEATTRLRLLQNPGELESMLDLHNKKGVVIDEIQKVPELLDEIHRLIEDKKIRFLLTGSSARKLKRTSANLLGGRARTSELFPLTYNEIPNFNLQKYLTVGGLPYIYNSKEAFEDLLSYVNTYLGEEVEQEARVRQLGKFARFLKSAAISNTLQINYANIASDSMVSESTVKEHYQILCDTLLGNLLEPWKESKKRKAIQTPKFYFFDTGIANAITGKKTIEKTSDDFGKAFEHFIYMELRAALSYLRIREPLLYWRSVSKQEVDFVIGDHVAIEVKSKTKASLRDAVGLTAIKEEGIFKKFYLVSQDPIKRQEQGITFIHWEDFLEKLWLDKII